MCFSIAIDCLFGICTIFMNCAPKRKDMSNEHKQYTNEWMRDDEHRPSALAWFIYQNGGVQLDSTHSIFFKTIIYNSSSRLHDHDHDGLGGGRFASRDLLVEQIVMLDDRSIWVALLFSVAESALFAVFIEPTQTIIHHRPFSSWCTSYVPTLSHTPCVYVHITVHTENACDTPFLFVSLILSELSTLCCIEMSRI